MRKYWKDGEQTNERKRKMEKLLQYKKKLQVLSMLKSIPIPPESLGSSSIEKSLS